MVEFITDTILRELLEDRLTAGVQVEGRLALARRDGISFL